MAAGKAKNAGKSEFVYVTYIKTTPKKLWSALTDLDFARKYWLGGTQETDWKVGSSWKLYFEGSLADAGEIVEFNPPERLAIKWRHELSPKAKAEGYGLCVMELEPVKGTVKLTVTHSIARKDSKLIEAVSGGWPSILSNLKSLLETGKVIMKTW